MENGNGKRKATGRDGPSPKSVSASAISERGVPSAANKPVLHLYVALVGLFNGENRRGWTHSVVCWCHNEAGKDNLVEPELVRFMWSSKDIEGMEVVD